MEGSSPHWVGRLARTWAGLTPTAVWNPHFNASATNSIEHLLLQPDGKILVKNGTSLDRLNGDGTGDTSFTPYQSTNKYVLALQADGKILAGNQRLNPDGALDTNYQVGVSGPIRAIAVQTDGKILVGGDTLARVNSDGSLDPAFSGTVNDVVQALLLQKDGRILVRGYFNLLNGEGRPGFGRLNNTSEATENLTRNGATVTWLRGGTGPEVWRVSFEGSTNGIDWANLGTGARIPGGWQLQNVDLSSDARIRARGFAGAQEELWQGSAWFVEAAIGPPFVLAQPLSQKAELGKNATFSIGVDGSGPVSYQWQFNGAGIPGATSDILTITNVQRADAGNYTVVVSSPDGSFTSATASLQTVDPFYGSASSHGPSMIVPQLDGKMLLAGPFVTALDGRARNFGRLQPDGTFDLSFLSLGAVWPGHLLVLQPDGKIIAYGERTNVYQGLGRRNADGSFDTNFDAAMGGTLTSVMLQPDGKILVAGSFKSLGGQACTNFGRISSEGILDTSFRSGAGGYIRSLTIQPDGKILAAGTFTSLGGQPCKNLARLYSDGTFEPGFQPQTEGTPYLVSLQENGKILIYQKSAFSMQPSSLVRLNEDGTVDPTFFRFQAVLRPGVMPQ